MEQNVHFEPLTVRLKDLKEILENTPLGPWELLLGVICLMLARGPGCRSVLGIPWNPPNSAKEEAKNNTKLATVHQSPSATGGP